MGVLIIKLREPAMTDNSTIAKLILKQLHHELPPEERVVLETWINASPPNRRFMERHADLDKIHADLVRLLDMNDEAIKRKLADLRKNDTSARLPHYSRLFRKTISAAAVLVVIVAGLSLLTHNFHGNIPREEVINFGGMPSATVLALPGPSTCLILSEGGRLLLKRLEIGKSVIKDGCMILRKGEQDIACFPLPAAAGANRTIGPVYHTISVAYGESWQVCLPDGSKVQVGAGSTLAFNLPLSSDLSPKRLAILRGEAYFEIAADSKSPFAIRTALGEIGVLGTSFNLRDYGDQDGCRATLLQGAIKVQYNGRSTVLHPGEQAWISQGTKNGCAVKVVDTPASVNWRSTYFDFTQKRIPDVMQQLTSWYGCKGFTLQEGIDTISEGLLGGGHISKDLSLKELLRALNNHSDLDFKVEARTIQVSKKH